MFGRGLQTRLLVNAVQGTCTLPYKTPSYTPDSCTVSTYNRPLPYHSSRQLVITVQVSPYHTFITPSQTLISTHKLPLITYSQLTYSIPLISLISSPISIIRVQGCCSLCSHLLLTTNLHHAPYLPYYPCLITSGLSCQGCCSVCCSCLTYNLTH